MKYVLLLLAMINLATTLFAANGIYSVYFTIIGALATISILFAAQLVEQYSELQSKYIETTFKLAVAEAELDEIQEDCERLLDTIEEGNYP